MKEKNSDERYMKKEVYGFLMSIAHDIVDVLYAMSDNVQDGDSVFVDIEFDFGNQDIGFLMQFLVVRKYNLWQVFYILKEVDTVDEIKNFDSSFFLYQTALLMDSGNSHNQKFFYNFIVESLELFFNSAEDEDVLDTLILIFGDDVEEFGNLISIKDAEAIIKSFLIKELWKNKNFDIFLSFVREPDSANVLVD